MSYKLKDIIYTTKDYWVLRVKHGYEVYEIGATASTRVAQIGWPNSIKGEHKATRECIKRQENMGETS